MMTNKDVIRRALCTHIAVMQSLLERARSSDSAPVGKDLKEQAIKELKEAEAALESLDEEDNTRNVQAMKGLIEHVLPVS